MGAVSQGVSLLVLRSALEASWDARTSHQGAASPGNPALGQCYSTSWVIQQYFPESEIVEGLVASDGREDVHFWNVFPGDVHVDLTWHQFPLGTAVHRWRVRHRDCLGDGPQTVERCQLRLGRVRAALGATADGSSPKG